MPAISTEIRILILVATGIVALPVAYLTFILEPNLKYFVRKIFPQLSKKGGRPPDPPTDRPWIVWLVYIVLALMVIIGTASGSTLPSSDPPTAETMHYFLIVDSSARMAKVFPGSDSKWEIIKQAIHVHLLSGLPERANYSLIVLGGNQTESTQSCSQKENQIIVPMGFNNRDKVVNTIETMETGGIASLNDALVKAKETLFNTPQNQHRAIMLFLGGGDECAKDKWFFLKLFLENNANLLAESRMDIVVFRGDNDIINAVNEIQRTIDKNKLTTKVTVYTPFNLSELDSAITVIQAQALKDALGFEPDAATVAITTASAIAQLPTSTILPTYTFQPTYTLPPSQPTQTQLPTNPPQPPLPTYTLLPTFTSQAPQPTYTFLPTYTPQPPQPTYTFQPTYTLPPPSTCVTWEFSTNDNNEGWLGQGITLEIQSGSLMGKITEPQGYWTNTDNLDVDANTYKTLEIRYRIQSTESPGTAYIYWITADDPQFEKDKRARFDEDVQTDYTWQVKSVDLSQLSLNWNGNITGIRLYPVGLSNADALVEYDYIRLCQ